MYIIIIEYNLADDNTVVLIHYHIRHSSLYKASV